MRGTNVKNLFTLIITFQMGTVAKDVVVLKSKGVQITPKLVSSDSFFVYKKGDCMMFFENTQEDLLKKHKKVYHKSTDDELKRLILPLGNKHMCISRYIKEDKIPISEYDEAKGKRANETKLLDELFKNGQGIFTADFVSPEAGDSIQTLIYVIDSELFEGFKSLDKVLLGLENGKEGLGRFRDLNRLQQLLVMFKIVESVETVQNLELSNDILKPSKNRTTHNHITPASFLISEEIKVKVETPKLIEFIKDKKSYSDKNPKPYEYGPHNAPFHI